MGAKARDLTGKQFGRLTVKHRVESRNGKRMWLCACSCGGTKEVATSHLTSGGTKSCGCLLNASGKDASAYKHGCGWGSPDEHKESKEWIAWQNLKKTDPDIPKEWNDFHVFLEDMGEKPSQDHRLGKRDYRLPHSKENTYWRNAKDERDRRKQLGVPMDIAI